MLLHNLYYLLKPILPWRLRIALRRERGRRVRAANKDTWPINPKAGAAPPGWPGWPDGKKFAVVLSHDVEGSRGYDRVEKLMNLESRHGFTSSFNFVPAGEYQVSDAIRETLDKAGFEVGIHGLRHDGKLYTSRGKFAENAAGIREYARRWGAAGFRSPFMQHKLAWLHELGLEYDASTFDTDPFEPQTDSANTIFPFWVAGNNGGGYVELPYTLVQDFSLFVILREPNIDIWKQKVDWLAEAGGMILLNTHPDYMCFEGAPGRDEFPVAQYAELLDYINTKYEGAFWRALPREVARHYCASLPPEKRNSHKKICMVTYSSYETDNRVRRYAESLVARGDEVDVVAFAGGGASLGTEVIKGVTLHRVQCRDRNERNALTYLWRLVRFLIASANFVTRNHKSKCYDVIHVHNIPDFMVFSAWYPKSKGVKVILDIHDIVPELYASKFDRDVNSPPIRMLKAIEKMSMCFADHVIVSNHLWCDALVRRSVAKEKTTVFLNHVDTDVFYPHKHDRDDGKFIMLFPGSFQWHQGLDIAIRASGLAKERVPNLEMHIYGGGHEAGALLQLTQQLCLEDTVKFCGSTDLEAMAGIIANADLGVVPKRADSFGNEAYSTKIMEFMSQGVPVVASRTKIDTYYYTDAEVCFFPSGDEDALAEAIVELSRNREARERLIAAGHAYVEEYGWNTKKKSYLDLIDSLTVECFTEFNNANVIPAVSSDQQL